MIRGEGESGGGGELGRLIQSSPVLAGTYYNYPLAIESFLH